MNEALPESLDSQPFETACDWFVKLREQPQSSDLVEQWLAWCQADTRNREAFEEVRELWRTTGLIPREATGELAATTFAAGALRAPRKRRYAMAAAAAVLALVAGGTWFAIRGPFGLAHSVNVATFTTERSERRSFKLADGSRIDMAGDSKLTVSLGKHARDIDLQQGEAYFSVAHDKTRPFIVHAGAVHVRAIGTRFDVRTADDRVVVAVEEGVVVVEPPREGADASSATRAPSSVEHLRPVHVRAGQEVAVGGSANELQLVPIEPTAVASWREGRLRFAREPLRSVIASIRAASGQEIELTDPALGDLRFTGTVFSSRVDAWVHGLPAVFPVTVTQDGAQIVIAPRE